MKRRVGVYTADEGEELIVGREKDSLYIRSGTETGDTNLQAGRRRFTFFPEEDPTNPKENYTSKKMIKAT
ncbi:hypothetical protein AB9P05_18185 [Roseivirga sp. BDSF3-8]|uniref:hypothetical protein n=1 Tax=Roseivirga sp. BDSF3-8 TaxID=3241598 RepID=UPI003531DAB9